MLQLNQARRTWPRLGRPRIFGPLLVYDLVRTARRKQQVVLRCLYAAILLGAFFVVYAVWAFNHNISIRDLFTGAPLAPNALADFAESFFLTFLGVQFLGACLLTPVWTAGAIPEDRESRVLEFLLTTDLRNREIVLSLALSRLINLAVVILTGLPFLSLLLLLGGIDRHLLLFGFAVSGLTMVSLTALGVVVSVYAYHPRQAVLRTYLWAGAYLLVSSLSWLLILPALGWADLTLTPGWMTPVTVHDLVQWLNAGNPAAMTIQLYLEVQVGVPLDTLLRPALIGYAVVHLLSAAVFAAWAIVRLRVVALAPPPGPVRRALPLTQWRWRPRVGNRPMLWKELFAEPGLRLQRLGRIAWGVLVPASFLPVVGILYYAYLGGFAAESQNLATATNVWIRVVGTLVACLMLVEVALRAAGSVRGERDRHTLDCLLTTPLGVINILFTKWFGSIAGLRRAWLWLASIGLVGIAFGGLDWRAVPALVLLWLILAAFFASLGLWFSVVSATAQRALLGTLLAVVGVTAGHWLLWVVLLPLVAWLGGPASAPDWLIDLEALGLTPAVTFAWLAYPSPQAGEWAGANWEWAWIPFRQGLLCWAVGAVLLGAWAFQRFPAAIQQTAPPKHRVKRSLAQRLRPNMSGAVAMVILAFLVWYLASSDSTLDRWREAVAAVDLSDPGWRLDELEARRKVIPNDQNSLFVVPAIPDELSMRSVPRWYPGKQWPTRKMEWALKNLAPEARLNDIQLELLKKGLADVQTPLAQARRLADFPDGRNPITYSKDGVMTTLPYAQRNRTIATLLAHDVLLRAQQGDGDGALASCRAMINSGRCIGDEPTSISMLIRLACRADALARLERTLAQAEPSDQALALMQQLLEKEETEPLLLIAARGERAMLDRLMDAIESGALGSRDILRLGSMFQIPARTQALVLTGLTIKSERTALLRFTTAFVEIAKLPVEDRAEPLAGWASQKDRLPGLAHALAVGPFREFAMINNAEIHRHHHTLLRCALVMTALERYRLAHGRWPETLDGLVPALLPAIPKDPYDGRPLRYRLVADGVVIYSVGPDGQDDGGVKLTQHLNSSRNPPPTGGTDVGFRLWDIRSRRQAPRPLTDAPPQDD
jgi:ABC-type transport system involved in multi-copper enzyme maturation permease subunit